MGPFWRANSPKTPQGGSIVRSATPGDPVFVTAWVRDLDGRPLADVEVDVWQASGEGYYENQDPEQAEMNLRGKFDSAADGSVRFRTVKPSGYPIPVNGPVGALIRAQGRHNMRPAHIHFLLHKPGYKAQFSQLYSSDDPNLETDVQFGVTRALVGQYVMHEELPAPAPDVRGRWYSLEHTFVIVPGDHVLPLPPITAKTDGLRAPLEVLTRTTQGGSF